MPLAIGCDARLMIIASYSLLAQEARILPFCALFFFPHQMI